MFGSDERLIQLWLYLYPMFLFPRTPFKLIDWAMCGIIVLLIDRVIWGLIVLVIDWVICGLIVLLIRVMCGPIVLFIDWVIHNGRDCLFEICSRYALELRIAKDTILYCDTCFTAQVGIVFIYIIKHVEIMFGQI